MRVEDAEIGPLPGEPSRSNYFNVFWVQSGWGSIRADAACYPFAAPSLLFFVPYQALQFVPETPVRVANIQFHANFLCIETYHDEIGCNGVLFNDVFGVPIVALEPEPNREIGELIGHLRRELAEGGLAHSEIILSYLKILLIRATRLKKDQQGTSCDAPPGRIPALLASLRDLIERHYREIHAPADYAKLLHAEPRTLGKLVKVHLRKTLTELIRDRILKQARWDLLHTRKPVKQVAHELGYADELYFSRLFKRATGHSPAFFREFETEIRGGRNLSMTLPLPSIPPSRLVAEDGGKPASVSGQGSD